MDCKALRHRLSLRNTTVLLQPEHVETIGVTPDKAGFTETVTAIARGELTG